MAGFIAPGVYPGYVVMPLKDYDELVEQLRKTNHEVVRAQDVAAEVSREVHKKLDDTLDSLCTVERNSWGAEDIVVHFNEHALYDLAMRKLVKGFSDNDLARYDVYTVDDFKVGALTLCRRKSEYTKPYAFGASDMAVNNCGAAAPDAKGAKGAQYDASGTQYDARGVDLSPGGETL